MESTGNSAAEHARERAPAASPPCIGKERKPDYAYSALRRSTKQGGAESMEQIQEKAYRANTEKGRLKRLLSSYLGRLEDMMEDRLLFNRQLVTYKIKAPEQGIEEAGAKEIETRGVNLNAVRVFAKILQETETCRKMLYALQDRQMEDRFRVEMRKLDLMERRLEGETQPGDTGVIFLREREEVPEEGIIVEE